MHDVVGVLVWTAIAGGFVAVLAAAVATSHRRGLLWTATVLWGITGVLGILSIGIVLLALAAVTATGAARLEAPR